MGEFPESAIRGSSVAESTSVPATSTWPSQPIQAADPAHSTESSSRSETNTSTSPVPLPPTSKTTTSFSHASDTIRPSTTLESRTSVTASNPPPSTTSIQPTSTTPQMSTSVPQSTSSQVATPISVAGIVPTTTQQIITPVSTTLEQSTNPGTSLLTGIVSRPIITPTPTQPPPLATTAPTANAHLSFGAIVGIVAVILVVLVVAGTCLVLGPRRTLRKVGIGGNRDDEKIDYEEWEQEHRESGTWNGRRASVGASSDWWRPPPAPFPTRPSATSVGGPGIAGVGAGRGMGMDGNTSPIPRRMSQRRVEERGAVRSGWFAASMVRGASLLSLGSFVRPATDSSNSGSERMSRMGTGGSAGRRFQELYRRERASASSTPTRPTEYLATVSELGERKSSGGVQHRAPSETGGYRPRPMAPKVRRPSRLATSYVPEIVVQDATLPNLSSVSSVTHESGGRGYDADAEIERRPRVI